MRTPDPLGCLVSDQAIPPPAWAGEILLAPALLGPSTLQGKHLPTVTQSIWNLEASSFSPGWPSLPQALLEPEAI